MSEVLDSLVSLSRLLGDPARHLAIIGEGNTSVRADDDSFYVKASGHHLGTITAAGFVQVQFAPILRLLDEPLTGPALQDAFLAARVDQSGTTRPSVEVTFHAMLLAETGAHCIAHTHPVEVNKILCSTRAEQFADNRIFPDEVVLCGPRSVLVPYFDPGLPLAVEMRRRVRAYIAEYNEPPKVILLANHGLITLGSSTTDAFNITQMAVKSAAIFAGACAIGEPVFMSQEDIHHIYKRPDEIFRRRQFV
jgi:rhamnose utilization protein RhaD (predicted bifunctional aldolase and dehydrogenase)